MNKTYYTYYNVLDRKYSDEDGYLVDLADSYLFEKDEKQEAIDGLNCFDEPEQWKVIGVKVTYETFDI